MKEEGMLQRYPRAGEAPSLPSDANARKPNQ